jgi:hypothetical protein
MSFYKLSNCQISGVRSSFILPFGSWLFTKKKGNWYGPQHIRHLQLFSPQNPENQLMLCSNQLNVVWASHLHILFQWRITIQEPIVPLFVEITTLESSVEFEWVIQLIGNLICNTTRFVLSLNCCICWAWRFYLNQSWIELWEVQNFISVNFISWSIS